MIPSLTKKVPRNTAGRTFAIGDLHGHVELLYEAMEAVKFDKSKDRILSPGDTVDRGPSSERVTEIIHQPWFFCTRGNHEQMALESKWSDYARVENGAAWFITLPSQERIEFMHLFGSLPIAIETETALGKIGVVHADVPGYSWNNFTEALENESWPRHLVNSAIWERSRWQYKMETNVSDVDLVIVGHTWVENTLSQLGNVINLDTGCGYKNGFLTMIDLDTLEVVFHKECPSVHLLEKRIVIPEPWGR